MVWYNYFRPCSAYDLSGQLLSFIFFLYCEKNVSMGGKTFHVTGTHSRAQFSHVLFSDLLALAGLGCLPTLCSTRQIVRLTSVNLDLDVQASFFFLACCCACRVTAATPSLARHCKSLSFFLLPDSLFLGSDFPGCTRVRALCFNHFEKHLHFSNVF